MSKITLFLGSLDTLLKKVTYLDFVVKNSENSEAFFSKFAKLISVPAPNKSVQGGKISRNK